MQLKFYLRQANDMEYCPRCKYAGFRPPKCYRLNCPSCHKQWDVEPDFVSVGRTISDWTSEAWKMAFTKECPTCLSAIEKNEGCNHMTCGRCNSSFCWDCMQKYRLHSSERCHTNLGPATLFLTSVIALVLAILKLHTVASAMKPFMILIELVLLGVFLCAWSIPAFTALYKFKVMQERSLILEVMVGVGLAAIQVSVVFGLYWFQVVSVCTAVGVALCGLGSLLVYNHKRILI
jgi:hypothetical protein